MKVCDAMTRDVRISSPDATIEEAAKTMLEIDAGVLPVGDNDRLVGVVTDRDIAIRGIGFGKGPRTPVREVMSTEVRYCFEDDEIDKVARNMATEQIKRLPVVNRAKRLVGIISLGDVATTQGSKPAGEALVGISQPGGAHSHSSGPHP